MTLFTQAELETFLGETVTTDQYTQAEALASGRISDYAPRALGPSQSRTVTLAVHDGAARLPHRPVVSITSVAWVVGDGTTTPVTYYWFNGIDEISGLSYYLRRYQTGFPTVDEVGEPGTIVVTYVGGVVTPSEGVKGIGLELARRQLISSGLLTETLGSYSSRAPGDGSSVALLDSEKKELRRYRAGALSSRLR